MAANLQSAKAESGTPQGSPDEWSEEQIQDALEQLRVLHVKCRELRSIVPRMVEPLVSTHATQQDAFASLHKSVASATAELQDFRALYTSDETKKILEQAAKSREAQPENIKTWRARDHPDWLESKKMSSAL